MKTQIIDPKGPLFAAVVSLGKQHAKTLGMFPEGAFLDHAKKKLIFGAVENDCLLGYILFRATQSKQTICITHLCVKPSERNKGIAKLLLNSVKDKYQRVYKGISLSCRKDYVEASRFWEKYGFKAIINKRSKSKEENYLVKWWYDFGNQDLFSGNILQSPKVNALLDSNIIMKISDNAGNVDAEAMALVADWLHDEADYYYAPEVFNEINRDTNVKRAETTRQFVHNLREARFNPVERNSIFEELNTLLKGHTPNDESDKKQLAECIAAGVDYFLTLDQYLLNSSEEIYERFSVKLLRPADFILFIDYNIRGKNYHSFRVAGADYTYSNIKENELEELTDSNWISNESGEKKHNLRQKLTAVISDIANSYIRLVRDGKGICLGYFAASKQKNVLHVCVLRLAHKKIADILFQQLIKDIIVISVDSKCEAIQMDENCLSYEHHLILTSFGFQSVQNKWIKIILQGQSDFASTISNHPAIKRCWKPANILQHLENLHLEEREKFKLSIEKKLWPVKFLDIDVPIYIIPIRPYWAGHLFDFYISGNTLFGAKAELTWLKENIYYRSVKPVTEQTPGRILWYVSTGEAGSLNRDKSIVATSYLDEVNVGPAKFLYQKFKNFGVYEWNDINKLAKGDPCKEIKALRFSDTEVFKKAVPLKSINNIMSHHNKPINTFASPVQVSQAIFNDIYKLSKNQHHG